MTGRHQRRRAHARIPEQQQPRPLGIVDARTRVEHLVPDDLLAAPRLSYLTKRGVDLLVASMTDSGRCRECAR